MRKVVHVLLDVIESSLTSAIAGKSLQETVFVEEHHELKKVILGHLHRDFLKGIVLLETSTLQILPLKVFFKSEFVTQAEGAIRVLPQLPTFEVKDQEETGVDVVLDEGKSTS